jgi:hypothetical protein
MSSAGWWKRYSLKHREKNNLPEIDLYSVSKEFISENTPPNLRLLLSSANRLRRLPGKKGLIISPSLPLRGGDEGEGDACGFTNDCIGI